MALGGWRRDRVLACDAMISACRKEVGIERDSGLVSSVQCLAPREARSCLSQGQWGVKGRGRKRLKEWLGKSEGTGWKGV